MTAVNSSAVKPISNDSILPILIEEGVLTTAQANSLPVTADNPTIELFLRLNHLASEEQLLVAYAKLYGLPYIHLKNRKIKASILTKIPEMIARRYDVVAYDENKGVLLVAIASPRRFQANQNIGLLRRLQVDLGMKIAPAVAPLEEIRAAFVGYELAAKAAAAAGPGKPADIAPTVVVDTTPPAAVLAPAAAGAPNPYPVVSLLNRSIPLSILRRVPVEVASHYGFVVFNEPVPNNLEIAALDPAGSGTQQVLNYIGQNNQVKITLYQTDEESLDAVLRQYDPTKKTLAVEEQLPQEKESTSLKTVPAKPSSPESIQTTPPPPPIGGLKDKPSALTVPEITADQLITNGNEASANLKTLPKTDSPPTPKPGSENTLDQFLSVPMQSVEDLVQLVKTGNVPRMVAGVISYAVTTRASDIHIEAEKTKIRLRYRIDGELDQVLTMPRLLLAPLVSRIKILSQMKIDENRIPQDGRFGVVVKGREIDLRVSTLPTVNGEKVVIRILDKTSGIMSLEDMGMDGKNLKRIIENITKPYGVVLSTGPTGSGKSTTLYAILQRISKTTNNVITLEDPIEYEMVGINQTQIKPKIGFTFAEGLRSILRQDPNIIMVGEIRDRETAEMATHAALTGHLVLSTLHTNSASGALPRLINMGIEPFLITSSINAVEAQRLVRRVCPKCRVEEKLPTAVVDEVAADLKDANIDSKFKDSALYKFYRGQGCPDCRNGYRGRVGIFEVLDMSEPIEALAVKKEPASVIEEQAIKEGMITMKQDGLLKALQGLTTIEEVMKATTE